MEFPHKLRWLHISSIWIYRLLTWAVLFAGFLFAAVILGLRYWLLPNIENYREHIAQAVSHAANQRITIGRISANWDGIRPELVLENVSVLDPANQPVLRLSRIDGTLSWLTLAAFEPRFHSLEIYQPTLSVKRDVRGVLWIAGNEFPQRPVSDGGAVEWLLLQREILVRDASISWRDEMRGAPQLDLDHVTLRLANRGDHHRFGLRATPPQHLAGPIDVRGDLRADDGKLLTDWNGKLFVQLDHVDIAAWREWVPFPVEFPQGVGALRLWLGFGNQRLGEFVADLRLADVKARLAKDLPALELARLSGRVAWKVSGRAIEISTTKLGLTTQGGLVLPPADFLLRLAEDKDRKPLRGEMRANAIDLQPLALLADHLPLDAGFRKQLLDLDPKGSLYDVGVRWSGDWRDPAEYTVRGRFQNLAMNHYGKIPGFSGLTGNIDGTEKVGSVYFNVGNASVDMPLVFREPLEFDGFTAQIGWSRDGSGTEFKLNNVSFSNRHLSGTLFGTYRPSPDSRGWIDLTGSLTRADARHASLYVPLILEKSARDWLDRAFLAGKSNDVSLRIRGNLDEFPFPDNKGGVFQVAAKVTDGVIDYAEGWPTIANIRGDLQFRGKRMDVFVREGTILGAKLSNVHADIPDLESNNELLNVSGEAQGATGEFLSFIEKSPVAGMIDRFTEGMKAQGDGKLTLKLNLPLRSLSDAKVAGDYQFIDNTIVFDRDMPPVEQVNAHLGFTQSSVSVPNAAGTFLGGPFTAVATTQTDAIVRIDLQGRTNVDNLRRAGRGPAWMLNLRGSSDWRGTFVLRKKLADLTVESNLLGIASDLPPPFAKSAAEPVPVRLERKYTGPQEDQIVFSYGDILSAILQRRLEKEGSIIRRGNIAFGHGAAAPERDGVYVSGSLANLDFDRWRAFAAGSPGDMGIEFSGVDLTVANLDAFNRRFHDVVIKGTAEGGVWKFRVNGRELDGSADWQGQGEGKLTARLKKLNLPTPADASASRLVQPTAGKKQQLPALDVVVDQFQYKEKQLGKLELNAVPTEQDWHIEKLRITTPESKFAADGSWGSRLDQPRTQVNLQLDTSDIGKLLVRLGYPEGVRGGTATLRGKLAWPGAPQDFDYPRLSGDLVLQASKGQFVKLEPGIGKLLGILSLQALPRRISLDFHDIFSDGFAFDGILGAVNINHGVAKAENFLIQGPSARIVMSGELDLARENQNLRVRITPGLSESVSLAAGLIGGPISAVVAFIAQKMLQDPIDRFASYEYSVTGTWVDPQVSKIGRRGKPGPEEAD